VITPDTYARRGSENIFDGLDVDAELRDTIMDYIKKKLAQQPTKIRSDIEVTCFTYEGIEAIKQALIAGENHSSPEVPLRIKLIAPPAFVLTTLTQDKELGIEKMTEAIEIIKSVITSHG
jgi:translation initiation factor 2 subunit 1